MNKVDKNVIIMYSYIKFILIIFSIINVYKCSNTFKIVERFSGLPKF